MENPKELKKVIFHLVTNLPSPQLDHSAISTSPDRQSPPLRLAIIPPRKEKIVSAIEKIYSVIKTFPKETKDVKETIKKNNSITCIDTDDSENCTTESESNLNSNEKVSTKSDKPQYELPPLNDKYKKNPSYYVYEEDKNYHQTDVKLDTLRTFPQKWSSLTPECSIIQEPRGKHNSLSQDNSDESNIGLDLNDKSCVIQLPSEQIRSGIKRTSHVEDEFDTMTKKKIVDPNEGLVYSGRDSPSLEKFFDEASMYIIIFLNFNVIFIFTKIRYFLSSAFSTTVLFKT